MTQYNSQNSQNVQKSSQGGLFKNLAIKGAFGIFKSLGNPFVRQIAFKAIQRLVLPLLMVVARKLATKMQQKLVQSVSKSQK